MEASRRDATDEWVLPEHSHPPSVKELEARIDVAMARARSAEAAASAIGDAALDAAEQARRSAEAAERTHALVGERLGPQREQAPSGAAAPPPNQAAPGPPAAAISQTGEPGAIPPRVSNGPGAEGEAPEEDTMRAFIARADRISLRLQRLQSAPLAAAG